MKILSNTLKPVIERWSDPGDYPSGAGSGPLPSYDYVEYIDGQVVIELGEVEIGNMEGDLSITSVRDYFSDNAGQIDHDVSGLTVKVWEVFRVEGTTVTLQVEEFECDAPEPDYPDYEPEYDYEAEVERKEREDHAVDM
jgi:hypothetical protein